MGNHEVGETVYDLAELEVVLGDDEAQVLDDLVDEASVGDDLLEVDKMTK